MGFRQSLLNLFYPPRCPFCSSLMEEEGLLCLPCQQSLPWIAQGIAPGQFEFLAGCYASLWYEDAVRTAFHRYKFSGRRSHALCYATLMAQCIEDAIDPPPQIITWAPVSKKRRRRRGYDQSQLLATHLAQLTGLPLVPTLEKWLDTPPQSSLTQEHTRRANALGAYRLLPQAREQIAGLRILLVDDIATSGSTLSECARVLRTEGATSVTGVVLARARGSKGK